MSEHELPPAEWLRIEQVALSGQMDERHLQDLLAANPDMAAWLRARAVRRQSGAPAGGGADEHRR